MDNPVAGRIVQEVIDIEAFEAWRNPDLTMKRYLTLIEDVKDGLTPEQRAERIDQLQSSILLHERIEEAIVERTSERRRQDADCRAILGVT
jgi:hypothetical protein